MDLELSQSGRNSITCHKISKFHKNMARFCTENYKGKYPWRGKMRCNGELSSYLSPDGTNYKLQAGFVLLLW